MTRGRKRLVLLVVLVAAAGEGCAARAPVSSRATAPARRPPSTTHPECRCRPGESCWPGEAEWRQLASSLHGVLEEPRSPLAPCEANPNGKDCAAALKETRNPFFLQDVSGGTQSTGWLQAWMARPSARAVVAEDASDVAAAVDFARRHRLRLVVKGTGHDYLGRSSAPDSLLVWTHRMRRVTVVEGFVPDGCPATRAPTPAVTVGAGARWLEVYQEVTGKGGRYVQGGGCTTVGAAGGFMQGGGFGSFSKRYGIAAASMLEAEVVTADGQVRVANECRNQDLFWALRGGGGGTFGVVTRVTLATHPLPASFGAASGTLVARDDAAFRELLDGFVRFYRARLSNEHWGEQVRVRPDRTLEVSMVFEGLTATEAAEAWRPFTDVIRRSPGLTGEVRFFEIPARHMWDASFLERHAPGVIVRDPRPGAPEGSFWWAGDQEQVSMFWYAYQSRWLPLASFEGASARTLASALFDASRHWTLSLHFNKGQAGAAPEAVRRGRGTSMNPSVFDAAALVIVAAGEPAVPGLPGHEPDRARAEAQRARVAAAMKVIRELTPGSGAYVNEADYFEPDWQGSFWGANYGRLAELKRKYDPDGLFFCHHCVGSESWSSDGFCRSP